MPRYFRCTFQANPGGRSRPFQPVTLSWSVDGGPPTAPGDSTQEPWWVSLGGEVVDNPGSKIVMPWSTSNYTLVAHYKGRESPRPSGPVPEAPWRDERLGTVTVEVDQAACSVLQIMLAQLQPPIQSLFAFPVAVTGGWAGLQIRGTFRIPIGFDISILRVSDPRIDIDICIHLAVVGRRTVRCSVFHANATPNVDVDPVGPDFLYEPYLSIFKRLVAEFLDRLGNDIVQFAPNICRIMQQLVDSRVAGLPEDVDLVSVRTYTDHITMLACPRLTSIPWRDPSAPIVR